jgi:hypothetical protein
MTNIMSTITNQEKILQAASILMEKQGYHATGIFLLSVVEIISLAVGFGVAVFRFFIRQNY